MPGPYAHITLLNELMQPDRLSSIFSPSSRFPAILKKYQSYCMLGAVSPDYPNLIQGNSSVKQWADAIHCQRACKMIASGIELIKRAEETVREKQLSWLLGYCAHVATDVTIHPVVHAKVGEYAENQRQHRICEMNQDSYIYRRMKLGEIGDSDSFAMTILKCSNTDDKTRLDSDIATLWEVMLKDVHQELSIANPPDVSSWHSEFVADTVKCAADAERLFPLAGVISAKISLDYPVYEAVDRQYIAELIVPKEKPLQLHYDDIFYHATCNVAVVWMLIERAVCEIDLPQLTDFGDWNLDTGRDEHNRLVFW